MHSFKNKERKAVLVEQGATEVAAMLAYKKHFGEALAILSKALEEEEGAFSPVIDCFIVGLLFMCPNCHNFLCTEAGNIFPPARTLLIPQSTGIT